MPITTVTHPLKIMVLMTNTVEPADACQAHNDPIDPGSDDGEEILNDDDDDEGNATVSSYLALDDVTVLEAAELGAVALLADTWDNDKGKSKGKGRGKYPVRPSHLSLEDRRRRLREVRAQIECRACGRKGHRAHDRECAMSLSSSSTQSQTRTARMTTQQHLSNKTKKIGMYFVLSDYSDEPDSSANMVGQNVPLPKESAGQTLLTPIAPVASATVDTKKGGIFDVHAMDDDDEAWSSETDHNSGWNKESKGGAYRGMLYGIVCAITRNKLCL